MDQLGLVSLSVEILDDLSLIDLHELQKLTATGIRRKESWI
jgi:hypothetical protein